jgi:hypothetical protein
MLVTLALMLIIFVMLYGRGSASFQRQQKTACRNNLMTLYMALDLYSRENNGAFPAKVGASTAETPLALLVPKYTTTLAPFICPGTKDSPLTENQSLDGRAISYAYYMGLRSTDTNAPLMSDRQVNANAKQLNDPVFSANGKGPGSNHHKYGGNILLCGGEVESIGVKAQCALPAADNVKLLNPRK